MTIAIEYVDVDSQLFLEDGYRPRRSHHPGGVHDNLPGGQEDDPVLLRSGYH